LDFRCADAEAEARATAEQALLDGQGMCNSWKRWPLRLELFAAQLRWTQPLTNSLKVSILSI